MGDGRGDDAGTHARHLAYGFRPIDRPSKRHDHPRMDDLADLWGITRSWPWRRRIRMRIAMLAYTIGFRRAALRLAAPILGRQRGDT